jgi:hypothetical protein
MLDNNRWLKELEQLDGTCFDYRYMGTGKM